MTRIVVLVPYRPHETLDPLWGTLRGWWQHHHPDWPLFEADSNGDWSRAEAVNRASQHAAGWDVAVIADVCVWQRPETTRRHVATTLAKRGMTVPYEACIRLSEDGTIVFLDEGGRGFFIGWDTDRVIDVRQPHGGLTVIHRDTWETVGGMDPRFRIWGGEDDALYLSASTLSTVRRADGVLWQLHHPPMPRHPTGSPQKLAVRYRKAYGDRKKIRALVNERKP